MKAGDRVNTPRFCTVTIEAVFESKDEARQAGFTEPTYYYDDPEYGILGKGLDLYHMSFAAFKEALC